MTKKINKNEICTLLLEIDKKSRASDIFSKQEKDLISIWVLQSILELGKKKYDSNSTRGKKETK